MPRSLARRGLAEFIGTAFLLIAVIGSGIAASRLSPNNIGLELLANGGRTSMAIATTVTSDISGVSSRLDEEGLQVGENAALSSRPRLKASIGSRTCEQAQLFEDAIRWLRESTTTDSSSLTATSTRCSYSYGSGSASTASTGRCSTTSGSTCATTTQILAPEQVRLEPLAQSLVARQLAISLVSAVDGRSFGWTWAHVLAPREDAPLSTPLRVSQRGDWWSKPWSSERPFWRQASGRS